MPSADDSGVTPRTRSTALLPRTISLLGRFVSAEGQSAFRRNFLSVAKANVIAQFIALASVPLITRLFSPADFGVAAIFTSIVTFASAICTWRFEWSIPNSPTREQSAGLACLSLGIAVMFSVLGSIVLGLFGLRLIPESTKDYIVPFVLLFPAAILGAGIRQTLHGWFTRENNLAPVSRAQISQSIAGLAITMGGSLLTLGPVALMVSTAFSSWAGLGAMLTNAGSLRSGMRRLTRRTIREAFDEFAVEASVSSGVSALNVASIALIPLLLARDYSSTEIGYYVLMNRLAVTPAQLFTSALGQSFWSEASVLAKTNLPGLRRLFLKMTQRLLLCAIPLATLCVLGSLLVGPMFGNAWTDAGTLLLMLTPGVVAQFVVQPVTHLVVHRKQHWKLYLDAGRLLFTFSGMLVLACRHSPIHLIVLWVSVVQAAAAAILYTLNLRCLPRTPSGSR